MIIESSNIDYASLTTISRLGIIYIDTNLLTLNCYFKRWLDFKDPNDWEESTIQNLNDIFDRQAPNSKIHFKEDQDLVNKMECL